MARITQIGGEGIYQLSLATGKHTYSWVFTGKDAHDQLYPSFRAAAQAADRPPNLFDGQLSPVAPPYYPYDFVNHLIRELSPPTEAERNTAKLRSLALDLEKDLEKDPAPLTLRFCGLANGWQDEAFIMFALVCFPSSRAEDILAFTSLLGRTIETEMMNFSIVPCLPPEEAPGFEIVGEEVLSTVNADFGGRPQLLVSALEDVLRPQRHARALENATPAPQRGPKGRI